MTLRHILSGVCLVLASTFVAAPSLGEVVVLAKSEPILGQGVATRIYDFLIDTPGDYFAELRDLDFLDEFALLAVGISETGGELVGKKTEPGSFLMRALAAGGYTAIVFAQPGSASYASSFSLKVALIPEPSGWLMIIAGLGFLGWQIRRRHDMLSVA